MIKGEKLSNQQIFLLLLNLLSPCD